MNDPVNLIDPSGLFAWVPGMIGTGIGGITGFIGAYNSPNATTGSILRSTAIGAAAGALSAYGGVGLGALVGFGANVASQMADGKSLQCVDYGADFMTEILDSSISALANTILRWEDGFLKIRLGLQAEIQISTAT